MGLVFEIGRTKSKPNGYLMHLMAQSPPRWASSTALLS